MYFIGTNYYMCRGSTDMGIFSPGGIISDTERRAPPWSARGLLKRAVRHGWPQPFTTPSSGAIFTCGGGGLSPGALIYLLLPDLSSASCLPSISRELRGWGAGWVTGTAQDLGAWTSLHVAVKIQAFFHISHAFGFSIALYRTRKSSSSLVGVVRGHNWNRIFWRRYLVCSLRVEMQKQSKIIWWS